MVKISAELNYLRMSPRKVRLIADVIRGKSVASAERSLRFLTRRASGPVRKLLKSAVANAKHNFQIIDPAALVVAEMTVDQGPSLKRRRPRAMGRAFPIKKRTSHVRLVLEAKGTAAPRKVKKADINIVRDGEKSSAEKAGKPAAEREAFKAKPKVATKTTDFVRRMFRRKAI